MEEEAVATVDSGEGMGITGESGAASGAGASNGGIGQGISVLGTVGSALLNNEMQKKADKRLFRQQEKMQGLQMEGNKAMTLFNQEQALKMWHDTNYAAQMEEMKKAGLSPGLIYGGSGAGGTTAQVTQGAVSGGKPERWSAGEGMGMTVQSALEAALTKGQTELVNAETEKTKTETQKMGGVDTEEAGQRINESKTRTTNTEQSTKNAAIEEKIKELQRQLDENNVEVSKRTKEQKIDAATLQNKQASQNIQKTEAETETARAEANNMPLKLRLQNTEQDLHNELIKQSIVTQVGTTAEVFKKIEKISEEIVRMQQQTKQGERGLNQEQQRIILDEIRTEFGSGAEAKMRAWIEAIAGAAKAVPMGKK